MGFVNPFKVPPSASIQCSKNFRFNPNYFNRFIINIMSYFLLSYSSTWQFHVTIFVALNSGKVKSILTLRLVVILPSCVCHYITVSLLGLSLFISLIIMIVELHLLSNKIWKFLNFSLPFCVFIHQGRIGYWWIFKTFVRLEEFSISCIKYIHLFYLLHFHVYKSYHSVFLYHVYF